MLGIQVMVGKWGLYGIYAGFMWDLMGFKRNTGIYK
jgi:hypothetical protein